jgi:ribosomal protein S18 acetylase RimI-like enzyme
MDETFLKRIVREAKEQWDAGQALQAGRLIFERIPQEQWATWAVAILELARGFVPPSPEIEAVIKLAKWPPSPNPENADEWRAAHEVVDAVNNLHYETTDPPAKRVFALAKDVAQVVYNSRGYPAMFDFDAGWEIADDLRQLVPDAKDAEFERRAWAALCNKEFIKLLVPPWYHYLAHNLPFPFKARYVGQAAISSLKSGDEIEVVKLASEKDCLYEILAEARWCGQTLTVPLWQMRPVEPNDGIEDALFFLESYVRRPAHGSTFAKKTATSISPATENDLYELADLYQQLVPNDISIPKMRDVLDRNKNNPNHLVLVARENGQVVGSLLAVIGEMLFGQCKSFMVIEDVVVDKSRRRSGIGAALMQYIEGYARERNCSYIMLITDMDRASARDFYKSLGYKTDKYCAFKRFL